MAAIAWPPVDLERLAGATEGIATRLEEPELRAQIFGLAAVIRHLAREAHEQTARTILQASLNAALASEDETAVLAAISELAALDRSAVLAINWADVTGG